MLTPDVLRFLRTIVPTDGDIRRYSHAAKDRENYFSELGRDAKNRVELIIKFRNHNWAYLHGYNDEDVRHCLWEIKMLLDGVYRAQQSDPYIADLVDSTAANFDQIHRMWKDLDSLLDGDPVAFDSMGHQQPAQLNPYRLVPLSDSPGRAGVSLGVADDFVREQSGLIVVPSALDILREYARGVADVLVIQAGRAMERETFDDAVANYEAVRTFYIEGQYDVEHAAALHGRGKSHVKNRRYDLAMADFEAAQQLDPGLRLDREDAAPYHNTANEKFFAAEEAEEYDEAIKLFTLVLELNPEGAANYSVGRRTRRSTGGTGLRLSRFTPLRLWEIYHDRGRSYLAIGNYESAISNFNESDRSSGRPLAVNELTRQIALCSIAVRSNPNDASARVDLARAYANSKEYDMALADLDKARQLEEGIDCSRDYWEVFVNRADNFIEEGQMIQEFEGDEDAGYKAFERAIENYTMALNFDANNAPIIHARGVAYFEMGQHRLSVEDYVAALDFNPDSEGNFIDTWGQTYEFDVEQCLFDKGKALAAMGNLRQAIQEFETILSRDKLKSWSDCAHSELNELGVATYNELGNTHFMKRSFDHAINSYNSAIAGISDEESWLELWVNRGNAFFRNKGYAAAIRDFNHVLDLTSGDYGTIYLLKSRGQAYAELGELEKAIADYNAYLEEFVRDQEVLGLREITVRLLEAEENSKEASLMGSSNPQA